MERCADVYSLLGYLPPLGHPSAGSDTAFATASERVFHISDGRFSAADASCNGDWGFADSDHRVHLREHTAGFVLASSASVTSDIASALEFHVWLQGEDYMRGSNSPLKARNRTAHTQIGVPNPFLPINPRC